MILGPAINIQRLPTGGRTYEYLSEDPVLSGVLAREYTRGAQAAGTAVCVKHYAVNNQETDRGTVNAVIDDRTLREIYLKPFEMAVVEGGAMGIMPAYNKVNGLYCAENDYLNNQILRGEWGFNGITVSDWGATHSTVGSALGGLNVQMPGDNFFGQPLYDAVVDGRVPVEVIDNRVRELLRVRLAIAQVSDEDANRMLASLPQNRHNARTIAEKSVVMLKNDGLLPINPSTVKSIAVIGANAVLSTGRGGLGSDARPPYEVSPLDGLRSLASGSHITYCQGYPTYMGRFNSQWVPDGIVKADSINQAPVSALLDEAKRCWTADHCEMDVLVGDSSANASVVGKVKM